MSKWRFLILKSAQRYLKRLSKPEQERIIKGLKSLLINPETHLSTIIFHQLSLGALLVHKL